MTLTQSYLFLALAIVVEVIGTTALKATDNFTRLWPSLLTIVCYAASFYLLTFSLKVLPTGIAYAIWSGLGIVLISVAALVVYGQKLDVPAMLGMAMIVGGVVVIQLFSKTAGH